MVRPSAAMALSANAKQLTSTMVASNVIWAVGAEECRWAEQQQLCVSSCSIRWVLPNDGIHAGRRNWQARDVKDTCTGALL